MQLRNNQTSIRGLNDRLNIHINRQAIRSGAKLPIGHILFVWKFLNEHWWIHSLTKSCITSYSEGADFLGIIFPQEHIRICSMNAASSATSILFFLHQSLFLLKILSRARLLRAIQYCSANKARIASSVKPCLKYSLICQNFDFGMS